MAGHVPFATSNSVTHTIVPENVGRAREHAARLGTQSRCASLIQDQARGCVPSTCTTHGEQLDAGVGGIKEVLGNLHNSLVLMREMHARFWKI